MPARAISKEQWLTARRIAAELDKVFDGSGPRQAAIARAAMALHLSTRQVYNLAARYRVDRTVTVLLPRAANTRQKRLVAKIEDIIGATLREQWLILEAPPLAPVVAEIQARCEEAGLKPPSYVTIARRIPALFAPEEIARKRSANPKHLLRLKPRPGYIHAAHALDVCQIDHTPADINFVEVVNGGGLFVGRPYLTIVTDVATRAILGFCLTLEKPSVLSVALSLAQAMCPKEAWLAARNLSHAWPMLGRPRLLVTDSAKEFKGYAFERGCDDYGIRVRYRDRGRVHHGGVVERLLGKLNALLTTYPGSSGRSVTDRDEYPSQHRACLSFADLERCVALAVIDHNCQENLKTLKVPLTEWQRDSATLPRFDDDPQRVLLSFLPGAERQLSPQGVSMFAMHYYSSWLGTLVPQRDRLGKLEVRYDPRDISHIYVRDPDTRQFRPVERRDGNLASLTLWEYEAERTRRRNANRRSPVEKVVFRREIAAIADAAKPSKRQLRDAVRFAQAAGAAKPFEALRPQPPDRAVHPSRQKRSLPIEDW
ncbi:transposase [Agrobacterium genomosp. 3 str. CIP 111-78]|uniref:DDE-type integrase/transposase/recombinase n=1 Tax=Agrobacterium tumefaciens TaxID=358 RepID=A0AAE6BUQ5_AGRTU|nr:MULTISPECIES: Mu transposase C-terminal domain-containing protein [Agrobacterium]KNY31071.1 transposase [Agrobacterium sp. SUL3]MCA2372794.1 transposase [Agrobacterium tomkonis CIP 111-78]QCM03777.1 DDE-type integrase/transposase/recombinase [Agrobacterium tumefaciens]